MSNFLNVDFVRILYEFQGNFAFGTNMLLKLRTRIYKYTFNSSFFFICLLPNFYQVHMCDLDFLINFLHISEFYKLNQEISRLFIENCSIYTFTFSYIVIIDGANALIRYTKIDITVKLLFAVHIIIVHFASFFFLTIFVNVFGFITSSARFFLLF